MVWRGSVGFSCGVLLFSLAATAGEPTHYQARVDMTEAAVTITLLGDTAARPAPGVAIVGVDEKGAPFALGRTGPGGQLVVRLAAAIPEAFCHGPLQDKALLSVEARPTDGSRAVIGTLNLTAYCWAVRQKAWRAVERADTAQSYRQFLASFQGGEEEAIAKDRIAHLPAREAAPGPPARCALSPLEGARREADARGRRLLAVLARQGKEIQTATVKLRAAVAEGQRLEEEEKRRREQEAERRALERRRAGAAARVQVEVLGRALDEAQEAIRAASPTQ